MVGVAIQILSLLLGIIAIPIIGFGLKAIMLSNRDWIHYFSFVLLLASVTFILVERL